MTTQRDRRVSRRNAPVIAIVIYVLAGVVILGGLAYAIVLSGSVIVARYDVPGNSPMGWIIFANAALLSFGLVVLAALLSYLHGIREYARVIAENHQQRQPVLDSESVEEHPCSG